jgi:hypothetical protein
VSAQVRRQHPVGPYDVLQLGVERMVRTQAAMYKDHGRLPFTAGDVGQTHAVSVRRPIAQLCRAVASHHHVTAWPIGVAAFAWAFRFAAA